MSLFVYFTELPKPKVNKREILRYMSCGTTDPETEKMLDRCLREAENAFSYRAVYCELPLTFDGDAVLLGDLKINSRDLKINLKGCTRAIVLAATVGLSIDRLILKYSRTSPAAALCMQAIGAERIEALCNDLCSELKAKYGTPLRPRFSPGYGDLSLDIQRDIFALLDCEKRLGLTLNSSLLMSPTKSVTAFVGIPENA